MINGKGKDKKTETRKAVIVQAELLLVGNRLLGWKFKAADKEGKELLNGLLHDTVTGLPYCKHTIIEPVGAGDGEYWIAIKS